MVKKLKSKKVIAFIVMFLITGMVFMNSVISANANVATKPSFKVSIDSINPNSAVVGEDITVKGTITPEPFETEVPEKEIVLVLDTSLSMKNTVNLASGIKSTRIDELKKAVKAFINKMKNVPNLKVSIVSYSDSATINPEGKSSIGSEFLDINDSRLITMIDKLDTSGVTNTGEGLRKAQYMLQNGNKNANKTIILMSDGVPTKYSVQKDGKSFFTDITNNDPPKYAGLGIISDENSKKYAITIGEIISSTANNVFSIGYGLGNESSESNKTMKRIHESMGGKSNNFFASDDGAIDKLFEQIAEEILATYVISNITMVPNLNPGFTLSVGSDVINLDNIDYKTDGKVTSGRVKYTADPVEFQFVIRANDDAELGVNGLFSGATITFPWKDEKISINVPNTIVEVQDNDLLQIKAELMSDKSVEVMPGEAIDITYKVTTEDFTFNDTSNKKTKDVVVLVDASTSMDLNQIKNSLFGKLINNTVSEDIKYSFVTYSNDVRVLNNFTANTNQNRNLLDQVIKEINNHGSSEKNIGIAISKAVQMLNDSSKGASQDADKYLVFIGAGNQSYNTSDSDFKLVKNGDYNVITLSTKGQSTSLENLHNRDLGKDPSNFILADDSNDIANNKMSIVADKINSSGNYMSYRRDVQLRFELGEKFREVINGEIQNSNEIIINLPAVVFNNIGNNLYRAEDIDPITFTVAYVGESYGEYKFNKGTISYTNLVNKKVNSSIELTLIKISQPIKDVIHGVENITTAGKKEFIEGAITIADDMKVNITAGAKITSSNIAIKLGINKIIDLNANDMNNIKVYKQINGELIEIKYTLENIGSNDLQNEYKITINEAIHEETNIVIKYLVKMESASKDKSYENNFIINGMEKSFILKGAQLPDLF